MDLFTEIVDRLSITHPGGQPMMDERIIRKLANDNRAFFEMILHIHNSFWKLSRGSLDGAMSRRVEAIWQCLGGQLRERPSDASLTTLDSPSSGVKHRVGVTIEDWIRPTTLPTVVSNALKDAAPEDSIVVTLDAPDFTRLQQFIQQQRAATDEQVAAQLHDAIERSRQQLHACMDWCSKILRAGLLYYDRFSAVRCTYQFLRLHLARTMYDLAIHQLSDRTPICTEFDQWCGCDGPFPTSAVIHSDRAELHTVELRPQPDPPSGTPWIDVYLPGSPLIDESLGGWAPATQFEDAIWTDFVIPQSASLNAWGIRAFCPWIREGVYWRGTGQIWTAGGPAEADCV